MFPQHHAKLRRPAVSSLKASKANIRAEIRAAYAAVANEADGGAGCCGGARDADVQTAVAEGLGYSDEDIVAHGDGNLGLGCGNPVAFAELKPGDHVLDLGSGAGFDALIAREHVGDAGHVIGVDMTRPMLKRARKNAVAQDVSENVEFREGLIEDLPVCDESIDVAISNCVVNLSPDKAQVFSEIHRVLKPGGKLVFSDILLEKALPEVVAQSMEALVGCVAGASLASEYEAGLRAAGFAEVTLKRKGAFMDLYADPVATSLKDAVPADVLRDAFDSVASYTIEATKRP